MARYIPGGRVVLADGTYEIGNQIQLTRQKTHLMGMGGATHLRPNGSTTGYTAITRIFDLHCRIGHMLIYDSDDPGLGDVRYAVYAHGNDDVWWPIIESVHTHGGEFRFVDVNGPGLFQIEHHGQPVPGSDNPGVEGIHIDNESRLARIHGGYISRPRRRCILLSGDGGTFSERNIVEGVLCEDASQESLGSYDAILLHNGITRSVVAGCSVIGAGARYGINEYSSGDENAILNNRLNNSGGTGDLSVSGTGSVSALNHADGTVK